MRVCTVLQRANRRRSMAAASSISIVSRPSQKGWGPAAKEIQADIPRYTDIAPIIQFNELKLAV
jgi:hypothetical protein